MPDSNIKLACSATLGYRVTLEETLHLISVMGFRYVDLLFIVGWAHIEPSLVASDPDGVYERIHVALQETGLKTATISTAVGIPPMDRTPAGIEQRRVETSALLNLAKGLGTNIMVIQPGGPVKDHSLDEAFEACSASFAEQAKMALEAGIIPALELHCNSPFESIEQGKKLLKRVPGMKLVFDPSHQVYAGLKTQDLSWVLDNAAHIHLRDAAPGKMQAEYGTGTVDFDWIISELKSRNYSGFIATEYLDNEDFDAVSSTLRLRKKLQDSL